MSKNNKAGDFIMNIDSIAEQMRYCTESIVIKKEVHHFELKLQGVYYIVRKKDNIYLYTPSIYVLDSTISDRHLNYFYRFIVYQGKDSEPDDKAFNCEVSLGGEQKYFFFSDEKSAVGFCLQQNLQDSILSLSRCRNLFNTYNSIEE
jgi:hypothetical protein